MAIIVHRDVRRIVVVKDGVKRGDYRRGDLGDVLEGDALVVVPDRDKGTSRALRPVERAIRRAGGTRVRVASSYLDLHEESNRRRENGWLHDLASNVLKALRHAKRRR